MVLRREICQNFAREGRIQKILKGRREKIYWREKGRFFKSSQLTWSFSGVRFIKLVTELFLTLFSCFALVFGTGPHWNLLACSCALQHIHEFEKQNWDLNGLEAGLPFKSFQDCELQVSFTITIPFALCGWSFYSICLWKFLKCKYRLWRLHDALVPYIAVFLFACQWLLFLPPRD